MVTTIASLAACAPAAAALGSHALTITILTLNGVAHIEGITFGAAVVAMGEGTLVGIGAIVGGSSTGIALANLAGPIGSVVVGCSKSDDYDGNSHYTWDCWKPVIHDTSVQPSHGMTLRCLAVHPNISSLSLNNSELLVENVFGEHFRLTPVIVKGILSLHASIV